jgi:hypothetical protein
MLTFAHPVRCSSVARCSAESATKKYAADRKLGLRRGVLDRARQPHGLIGDPPPLQPHSWSADVRSSGDLYAFLEPRDNWTQIHVDFEWTSEGTDAFLGRGDKDAPTKESR